MSPARLSHHSFFADGLWQQASREITLEPTCDNEDRIVMSLDVNPDTEARLLALAHASGLSVEEFLKEVVEERSRQLHVSASPPLTPLERAAAWRDSVKGLPRTTPLSDEAIGRESIYSERG